MCCSVGYSVNPYAAYPSPYARFPSVGVGYPYATGCYHAAGYSSDPGMHSVTYRMPGGEIGVAGVTWRAGLNGIVNGRVNLPNNVDLTTVCLPGNPGDYGLQRRPEGSAGPWEKVKSPDIWD